MDFVLCNYETLSSERIAMKHSISLIISSDKLQNFSNETEDSVDVICNESIQVTQMAQNSRSVIYCYVLNNSFNSSIPHLKKQIILPIIRFLLDKKVEIVYYIEDSNKTFIYLLLIILSLLYSGLKQQKVSIMRHSKLLNSISFSDLNFTMNSISQLVDSLIVTLDLCHILTNENALFISRTCHAVLRKPNQLESFHSFVSTSALHLQTDLKASTMKLWPDKLKGVTVFEFFSGIGGMRLSLPNLILETPISSITAFDCSDVANDVYEYNFHTRKIDCERNIQSSLKRILIDGLKVNDVDNIADVWTMSPPCQPYTTTKGAKQLDHNDNRSRGFYHLMKLLQDMKHRPRFIFLENVAGFQNSKALKDFKAVLEGCNYTWQEFLLSPINFGIPNRRRRYYMTIEHCSSTTSSSVEMLAKQSVLDSYRQLDINSICPSDTQPLGDFIAKDLSIDRLNELLIPKEILEKPWAQTRLSIVGQHDRISYCFTKGYGRIIEKSAGSCYFENALGPLNDEEFAINREELLALHFGNIRLFDPREVLNLSGFPCNFNFPEDMPLKKQWACIGNSISIYVVNRLMETYFQ